ncbi:DUF2809 domain-containing protein [Granulicella arctica]|uniref:DUF2809 domain-containing protein n=1 Tax=Granulicella arctica TaxID=940613 RepID=A0A7Y9PG44_9BACT|nr:DUF2809 domain-containing protein [Granulicella arctica]NYF78531.1 hypothetical protein [Granulicella arctica]
MNRRILCATLAACTICTGLVWRLAPLGLPPFLYKYGGSILWAAMVYWVLGILAPHMRSLPLAMIAVTVASCVELFRLIHSPALDAFRLTLTGKLLLGRVFSLRDIAAYGLAIAATAIVDASVIKHKLSALNRSTSRSV